MVGRIFTIINQLSLRACFGLHQDVLSVKGIFCRGVFIYHQNRFIQGTEHFFGLYAGTVICPDNAAKDIVFLRYIDVQIRHVLCCGHKIHCPVVRKHTETFINPEFTPISILLYGFPFVRIVSEIFPDIIRCIGKNQLYRAIFHLLHDLKAVAANGHRIVIVDFFGVNGINE